MDRPFMPKYGTVSQVLLQLVVGHSLLLARLQAQISLRIFMMLYIHCKQMVN